MNSSFLRTLGFVLVLTCTTAVLVHGAEPKAPKAVAASAAASAAAPAEAPAASAADDEPTEPKDDTDAWDGHRERGSRTRHRHRNWQQRDDNHLVSIGHDSHLESGEKAEAVVSVFGSSTSEGDAEDVVSVLGSTRVSGIVHDNAVAVLGNLFVDGKVEGDAVAVLGNIELGPNADIDGEVVSVFGTVHRSEGAVVHGGLQHVFAGNFNGGSWISTWVTECLLKGRPLALAPGLSWLWTLAIGALAFYTLLALMFRSGVERCVSTLESHPGSVALAALIAMLLTPVLIILLCVTVIGIAALPFVVIVLFCASLFGKVVALAWIGHRITSGRPGPGTHPALAVLVGGAIAMLLYLIPVIGFLIYKLLGFFGFGAVVYTLLLDHRARQAERTARVAAANGHGARYSNTDAGPARPAAPAGDAAAMAASAAAAAAAAAAASATASASAPSTSGSAPGGPASPPPRMSPPPIPPQTLATLPRAGFWLRMLALLIDVVLVGVLMESSGALLGVWHHEGHAHFLVLAIYGACMWKLRGSTVGGLVCDLRVVRADGRPLEWETAIVRALGCFLSLAVCGLGFIWIAFDSANQAWHDKIAGTVVVRVPKGAPLI
jgi:uncharacterized RDD family membrane protein YckC/cytoskeletal protein CcmA (bactofilin family)